MEWKYASLAEFKPHISAYTAEIRARRERGPRRGEAQQTSEAELADLAEILEAARELIFEKRDPHDVETLKRLRVDGKLRDDYCYLSKPINRCRIVYLRDAVNKRVTPDFIYDVNYSRIVPARGMLTLVSKTNDQ